MRDIAIFGAGGFGREVACLIKRINKAQDKPVWNFIGFFDDNEQIWGTLNEYGQVIGGVDVLNSCETPIDIVIAVGSPNAVKHVYDKLINPNISFPNVIDPSFEIIDKENFSIGRGNIIQRRCSISINVKIGNFNILNGSDSLGHDVELGDFNVLMPGVRISGAVKIGNHNSFGVGSIVIQQMKIGDKIKLAPGSVLMTKARKEGIYMGIPAKMFKF